MNINDFQYSYYKPITRSNSVSVGQEVKVFDNQNKVVATGELLKFDRYGFIVKDHKGASLCFQFNQYDSYHLARDRKDDQYSI